MMINLSLFARVTKKIRHPHHLTCLHPLIRKDYPVPVLKYSCMQELFNIARTRFFNSDVTQEKDLIYWLRRSRKILKQSIFENKRSNGYPIPKMPDKGKDTSSLFKTLLLIGVLYLLFKDLTSLGQDREDFNFISWNEFLNEMLSKGEVEYVIVNPDSELVVVKLFDDAIIRGKPVYNPIKWMKIPSTEQFEEKLRQAEEKLGVKPGQNLPVMYQRSSFLVPFITFGFVCLIVYIIFRALRSSVNISGPMEVFKQYTQAKFTEIDPRIHSNVTKVTFKDVAGLHEAKLELKEFMDYLQCPERFMELGAKIPRGALLLGPPGCGKTLLAKALSSEANVPFLTMAGSEFVEVIGGLGAARVRDLFKEARKRAPCIIYIDEIDAIGKKRSGTLQSSGEEEQTLNQLLVEMDGLEHSNITTIMLASTNRPDILDKALLRPGRFDRHIIIDYPTLTEREEILKVHLSKIKVALPIDVIARRLAALTGGMSGADLANVCNEAALQAVKVHRSDVSMTEFENALDKVTYGSAKITNTISPAEKRLIAVYESGHALVAWMTKNTNAVLKVSIVQRTGRTLGISREFSEERKLFTKDEILDRMSVALGGRAAETTIFNKTSTGSQDDLRKVTKWAYEQVRCYGMSDEIGLVSFPSEDDSEFASKPYSKALQKIIDEEAQRLVGLAYRRALQIIQEHMKELTQLTEELLRRETLTYEDLTKLWGQPPYPDKKFIESVKWNDLEDEKPNL